MKRYRLLKELPGFVFENLPKFVGVREGTIFEYSDTAHYHNYRAECGGIDIYLKPCAVEENTIWFEEVKEGMMAKEAIRQYAADSEGFKQQMRENHEYWQKPAKEVRRKAPAYVFSEQFEDWDTSLNLYCSSLEAEENLGDDFISWPALPDKDGYYPGPQ